MSEKMQVYLSNEPAPAVWGEDALLSFAKEMVLIHAAADNLGKIQQAGRKLDAQGLRQLQLAGAGWELENSWALYQGLRGAKFKFELDSSVLDEAAQKALATRIAIVDWVCQVTNESGEELTPAHLASRAAEFIKQNAKNPAHVSYKLVSGSDLVEQGWNGIYTVGRGSVNKPVMLQLDFNPTGNSDAPVFACLVGKGITFDSGGYSLKPSNFMDAMKSDMGGAALITGGLALAMANGLSARVKLILCCAENMVSSNAYKLGDIITYKNGKTVEVLNTDAEGRLVLADGLLYAGQYNPQLLIDCATLTGAAKAALGNDYHALFSFDDALAARSQAAALAENEALWRLPLAEFHRKMLPSSFADLSNVCSGQYSPGASTAAAFLSYFVQDHQRGWLHFDCSGAYRKTPSDKWGVGATGMGVRTLARILLEEEEGHR